MTTFTQVTDRPEHRAPALNFAGRSHGRLSATSAATTTFIWCASGAATWSRLPRTLTPTKRHLHSRPMARGLLFDPSEEAAASSSWTPPASPCDGPTDSGFDPDWLPTAWLSSWPGPPVVHPMSRVSISAIWVVTVAKGEKRQVFAGDAVGPRWSPSGNRIAYGSRNHQTSQRDVFTVACRRVSGTGPGYKRCGRGLEPDMVSGMAGH